MDLLTTIESYVQTTIQEIPFPVSDQIMSFHYLIKQYLIYKKQKNQIPFSPEEYSIYDKDIDFIGSPKDLIADLQSQYQAH